MSTVLLIGEDELLLQTRAAVLRTIGVETVFTDVSSALAALMGRHCDLVVFCHSLPRHMCETLAQIIRCRWPSTPLLLISTSRDWEQMEEAGIVDSVCSPEPDSLIRCTIELLGRREVRSAVHPSHRTLATAASDR